MDVLSTEVMLKQWESEVAMFSCAHHGVVRGDNSATEVSVVIVQIISGVSNGHHICFRGKDGEGAMVWHTRLPKQRVFEAREQLGQSTSVHTFRYTRQSKKRVFEATE